LEISFEHSQAGLFVFLSVLAALAISYMLYFRNAQNSTLSRYQKWFLVFLRFLSLLLVFLFLLSPLIDRSKKIKKLPIIAFAVDNSKSVQNFMDPIKDFKQKMIDELAGDYNLEFWTFGEKVENSETFTGTERRSDYGELTKSMKSYYSNKNLGALILVGDGIYNQGQNPANLASGLLFPVYSVGVGDTIRRSDAIIKNVRTNKSAYLKNKFPVEIELEFSGLKNQIANFSIENNGTSVYSGSLAISSDDDFKLEFANPEATKAGMQHYKVKIQPVQGETNLKNNEFEFVIQVLENKQKILLLSDGPHPDMGAIRNSLSELQNYEIKIITGNAIPDSLSSYGLIVLNQLPSIKNASSKLLTEIMSSRIPALFIIGPNSLVPQLNTLDAGLKISPNSNTEEVQPKFNSDFSLFLLSEDSKKTLEAMPPLIAPFGNTIIQPTMQELAFQNVKNITTGKVLLAFGNIKGRKTGFILGEGIWRWRLADFEVNGTHEAFDEIIQKIVQYLALRENEDNFNVYYSPLFQETDNIEFSAELYNDSYELVNSPDINISIKNADQKEFKYLFNRTDDHYRLNAGNLEPGDYTFEAQTQLGNQLYTEKGNFSIVKNELETQNTTADFNVLYQLSSQSGGKFFQLNENGMLVDEIKKNNRIAVQVHKQALQDEWINLKFLFFMLVIFLGTEWFLRKYWGIY